MSDTLPVEVAQHHPLPLTQLPAGWKRVWLADIASNISPGFASGKHSSDGVGVPHLRPMNVDRDGQIDLTVVKSVASSEGTELAAGEVLFNNTNSPELVGKTALISEREAGFAYSNHMTRVRLEPGVVPAFIARQFHLLWMSGYLKSRCTNHVNQASISSTTLASSVPLLLAPPTEQKRIVERLETVLSDWDDGVSELKAAQRKLAKYRQSLLKTAVEGELTAQWRAQRDQEDESPETGRQLLERILDGRRSRWEANELAKFEAQGRPPPKGWQQRYPEPTPPAPSENPTLPAGWAYATLSQIGWLDRGRSKHRPRNAPHLYGGPYPFVQTGDIRDAETYITAASSSYSEAGLAQSRLWPIDTLCITIAANIGKTAILAMDACFPDSVVGFLPTASDVSVRYVEYFMRTVQQVLEAEAPATAQKNINLEVLSRVCIPLPPLTEQLEVVRILDEQLGHCRDQLFTLTAELRRADAQRRNILKAAFSGELVEQDFTDEPAGMLLQRIRARRVEQETQPKRRKSSVAKDAEAMVKQLIEVLAEASDWLPAQEAFRRCGITDGAQTDQVEALYAELKALDKSSRLAVEPVTDGQGRKLYDRLRLLPVT